MGESKDKVSRTYLLKPESLQLLAEMADSDKRTLSAEVEFLIESEYHRRSVDGNKKGSAAVLATGDGEVGDGD